MIRYLFRRTVHGITLLLLISVLTFALFELAPSNYADAVRLDPRVSAETVAMLRARYGLDRPVFTRYGFWLRSALRGEFGFSFAYAMPVGKLLWPRARYTLLLTVSAAFLIWPAALIIGTAAAASRHTAVRRLVTTLMSFLVSLPELLVSLVILMFALRKGWFPIAGTTVSPLERLILPDIGHLGLTTAAMVLVGLPMLVRHTETALRESLESPFIQAARAHGIPPRRILLVYALPSASNALISLFGLSIGALLSASLVIEVVMSWPGLGPLVLEAVLSRDVPVVMAATLLSGSMFIVGNLLADVLLYATDPRIRRTS